MTAEGTAPDGSEIHVQRNHGKPTRAQELAKALADARKAKKAGKADVNPAQTIVAPAAAPSHTKMAKLAKEGLKPAADANPATEDAETGSTPAFPVAPAGANSPKPLAKAAPKPNLPSGPQPTSAKQPSADPVSPVAGPSSPSSKRRSMQVRFTGMKPLHVVEAALFAAGKPITVEEIAEQTGLPPDKVKDGIKELQSAYQDRDTILEVGKAGTKWAMQVRTQAAEPAAKFAPMEIAPKLLKTLALIAFHQPMKQSQLVDMMGTKVYDHIPELVQRGLVRAREDGPTKILGTTPLFPEYFGLDASDPDEIRALMGRLVGIVAPPKPRAETLYEDPQPQEPEQTPETVPAQTPAQTPT